MIHPGVGESMQDSSGDWENRCRNHTVVGRIDAGIIPGLGESMQESYRGWGMDHDASIQRINDSSLNQCIMMHQNRESLENQ